MSEATPDTVSHDWERIFSRAIASAYDAVLITDAELEAPGPRILYVNAAFEALTGYPAEEILGKTPRILQGPETERKVLDRLRHCLERGEPFEGQTVNYRKDGTPYQLEWRTAPVHDDNGRIQFFVSIQHDVTEATRLLRQLRHQADRDSLTATYNRGAIEQLVDQEIERARRSDMPLSLILLDIDHFKNESQWPQPGRGRMVMTPPGAITTAGLIQWSFTIERRHGLKMPWLERRNAQCLLSPRQYSF